jgi:hypothetical protein
MPGSYKRIRPGNVQKADYFVADNFSFDTRS